MPLAAGTRLGHYEIISVVGQGGMGTVHRARDTRLDRIVAIKVIENPAPDLRQRLAREARAIAALQHPHICTLYDVGSHEGTDYLVMEHLEGAPVSGPLPLPQVIAYGIQIADALDAAHRKGITHRDVKPSNILLTKSGAKVLDFGIARVSSLETMTLTGEVVGSPLYMAPEQWAGAEADARTDIYGLGRVLVEMRTGTSDPSQRIEPPALDAIVHGCLAKDPDDRWQSARDVRRMLQNLQAAPAPERTAARRPGAAWWVAAIGVALAAAAFAGWWLTRRPAPTPLQLAVTPPRGSTFVVSQNVEGGLALSPDGQSLAFVGATGGRVQLWVRRLDSFEALAIPGTDGAYSPFWSPDSRQIAFYTPDQLKKVAANGGPVQTICPTDPRSAGGAWMSGDVLLVTGRPGGGIHRIPAAGGESVRIADGHWPHALPVGRRFLFAGPEGILIASLDRPEDARPVATVPRGRVAFALDHLIYVRDRALVAHAFDLDDARVVGEPFPVAPSLLVPPFPSILNQPSFSIAPSGLLVYASGALLQRLRWRDRRGNILSEIGDPAIYLGPRISPDGRSVAYARVDAGNADVWITDSEGTRRLTFDAVPDHYPIWSPDSRSITYTSGPVDEAQLFRRAADGTGSAERLKPPPALLHAMDWSSDGQHLAFTRNLGSFGTDLLIMPATGDPYVFLQTNVSEAHAQFAPGKPPRWLAYSSDLQLPRREIFVTPFVPGQPASSARWQVSDNGGTMPRWKGDGSELYYWALDGRIMAVRVDGSGSAFRAGTPIALFEVHRPTMRTNYIEFDVAPDGQRFLVLEPSEQHTLSIVTNWLPR